MQMDTCLRPTFFLDSDHEAVQEYAHAAAKGAASEIDKGVRLYYAVRDDLRYNPYIQDFGPKGFKASTVLPTREGFCVTKAVVLAACARAIGIPSRLGFADVRNHLTSDRLKKSMGGDNLFVYHGMTLLYLNEKWVKCTPAFNLSLCERANILPLEFDGVEDSLFHPFDKQGRKHMEYVKDRGIHDDLPHADVAGTIIDYYSKALEKAGGGDTDLFGSADDFESEAYAG